MRLIYGLLAAALATFPAQVRTFQIGTPCDCTWDVGQIEIREEALKLRIDCSSALFHGG